MKVLSEFETMQKVRRSDLSLARFGRCELRLIQGHDGLAQRWCPLLQQRLRRVLHSTPGQCLVCIPRVWPLPPGKDRWYGEFTAPGLGLFDPERTYGSTFVSRRDAWVDLPAHDEGRYWAMVRGTWEARPVLLVAGSAKGRFTLDSGFVANAAAVELLPAPQRDAWTERERLTDDCLTWASRNLDPVVYLALGATATIMAHDLALAGVQALDLGHMAQSWAKVGKQAQMAA
jgi:hypothetical protein